VRHNAVVKAYLLYEVVEVFPGHHCDLRDLVRGGEAFRVHERMGTQNFVVPPVRDKNHTTAAGCVMN